MQGRGWQCGLRCTIGRTLVQCHAPCATRQQRRAVRHERGQGRLHNDDGEGAWIVAAGPRVRLGLGRCEMAGEEVAGQVHTQQEPKAGLPCTRSRRSSARLHCNTAVTCCPHPCRTRSQRTCTVSPLHSSPGEPGWWNKGGGFRQSQATVLKRVRCSTTPRHEGKLGAARAGR